MTLARIAALVLMLGSAACGSRSPAGPGEPPTSQPATSPPAVAEPADAWVAVLDTASDPATLNAPRKAVLHELGNVLEGSVVVSPVECFEGLPEQTSDGYVLAIQRDTREEVRSLVSLLSEAPSFTGDVTIVCSD